MINENFVKSVLMSIRPLWTYKIINGEKLIEIRKTRPKFNVPFKVYIYCTKGKDILAVSRYSDKTAFLWEETDVDRYNKDMVRNGTVIGEFICDEIIPIKVFENGTIQDYNGNGLDRSCVPYDDIANYIGYGKTGYGWHISNLIIYDKPMLVADFIAEGDCSCENCHKCKWFENGNGYNVENDCHLPYEYMTYPAKPIFRAPQSYCFVLDNSKINT